VLTAGYLTDAQRKGLSAGQIATATGFSLGTVTRHLRAHGLPVGPPSPKIAVDARHLASLVAEGVPTTAIATIFGCSVAVIQQRILGPRHPAEGPGPPPLRDAA